MGEGSAGKERCTCTCGVGAGWRGAGQAIAGTREEVQESRRATRARGRGGEQTGMSGGYGEGRAVRGGTIGIV